MTAVEHYRRKIERNSADIASAISELARMENAMAMLRLRLEALVRDKQIFHEGLLEAEAELRSE